MGMAERVAATGAQRTVSVVYGLVLGALALAGHPLAYAVWDTVDRRPEALERLRAAADPEPEPEPEPEPAIGPRPGATVVLIDGLRVDEWPSLTDTAELLGEPRELRLEAPTFSMAFYHAFLTGVPPHGTGIRRNVVGTRALLDSLPDRVRAEGGTVGWIAEDNDWLVAMYGDAGDLDAHGLDALDAPLEAALARPPELLVVHVLGVDETAHNGGTRTEPHRQALAEADRATATAVRAAVASGRALVVLSDHGHITPGGHGGDEPEVARAPIAVRNVEMRGFDGGVEEIAPRLARAMRVAPPRSAVAVPGSPTASERGRLLSQLRTTAEARRDDARLAWLLGMGVVALLLLGTTRRLFSGFDIGTLVGPAVAVATVVVVHVWAWDRPFTLSAIDDGDRHSVRMALLGAGAAALGVLVALAVGRLRRGDPAVQRTRRAAAAVGWSAASLAGLAVANAGGALGPWPLAAHAYYLPVLAIAAGAGACAVAGLVLLGAGLRTGGPRSAPEADPSATNSPPVEEEAVDDEGLARGSAPGAYEPNAILRWVYRRFFAHIEVDEHFRAAVRDAAQRGVVVYVMRSISFLDFLCLDWLVKKFGLPLVRFVNDLGLWILEPFGKGGRRLRLRRQIPEATALAETVREEHSALLFLRRPPKIGQAKRKGRDLEVDLIRTLVETQRQLDKPILLVPQTFVWSKLPSNKKRTLFDLFFGPTEWPGKIRVFFQFLLNFRNALLRTGDPFDLKRFVGEHQDLTDAEVADKVRYALLRRMEREREVVLGPGKKTPSRIRDELLRSPRVRKHIEHQARTTKLPIAKIERMARKDLRQLCAAQDPYMLGLWHRLLDRVWNRIYDGLEVDAAGLERVREAAREGSVVLLPSHKSHVDYLILSDVFFMNAMSPPLIAAGDNLSFWPLGPLLRRGGGFFIKRSFRGKRLYAAMVDAYIRKVLVEGFNLEFFLEGGRSRTGKLLPPKFGLLSMVVDACLMLPSRRVWFVPISIGYERVIEERSYVDELSGAEKQKENIGGLLKTPKVLRSRYGRLYVQFGDLVEFEDVLAEVAGHADDGRARRDVKPPERRNLVQTIGHRVVYEINRVTVVTPAALLATVALAHRRRGMTRAELVSGAASVAEALRHLGARFARSVFGESGAVRPDTVDEAVKLFMDGKLMTMVDTEDGEEPIYAVPEERRIALEYYKNNILHFFVASALISAAMQAKGGEPVGRHTLRERVRALSRLFKYEFMYRADADYDEIFDDALGHMLEAGELEEIADVVRPSDGDRGKMIDVYATMLRTYFETYRLAIRGLELLESGSMSRKDWLKRTLAIGQRMYLAGELELRESLSKARLENAMRALRDHRLLQTEDEETLSLGDETGGVEGLRQLEQRLAASLP